MYANQNFGSEVWLQNEKVLDTPFCPIKIGPFILKMVKCHNPILTLRNFLGIQHANQGDPTKVGTN